MRYEVTSPSGRKTVVEAEDSVRAKRLACRRWGIMPGDPWSGITSLRARRLKQQQQEPDGR